MDISDAAGSDAGVVSPLEKRTVISPVATPVSSLSMYRWNVSSSTHSSAMFHVPLTGTRISPSIA